MASQLLKTINPFPILFWVWCTIFMLLSGVLFTSIYFVIFTFVRNKDIAYKQSFVITKIWGRLICLFSLTRVTCIGAENLNPHQNYVFVSNHLSSLDIPICMSTCPIPFSFLAKKQVKKIPFVGYLAQNMHLLVDRDDERSRINSLKIMQEWLIQRKRSLLLFAEGTRNTSSNLIKPFQSGAFKIALESQLPLAPITIIGSQKILSPNLKFRVYPFRQIVVVFDKPISTEGLTTKQVPTLKNQVREIMIDNIQEHEPLGRGFAKT
jgi:1-acyl-sn-glycerol-3-phosphate acyltransferase